MAGAGDIAKRSLSEAMDDNLTGESAKVAYYLFLSLFPLIIVIFALTGIVGGQAAFEWVMSELRTALPESAAEVFTGSVREITERDQPGLLSVGILLTLWAASGGFAALADGLNRMYDLEETRSWWKKRLLAAAVLAAASVLLVGGAVLILAGPAIASSLGLGAAFNVLRWPLALALLIGLMWIIYYLLPNRRQDHVKREVLIGAAVGAVLWLLATLLFRLYVANFGSYSQTYGVIGGVIVLMLWLYITALTILFGGEVASVLEHRSNPKSANA